MRTFATKPKATQQTTSSKATARTRSHFGHNHEVNSILHLQRTIGNQAVLRLLEEKSGDVNGDLTTTELSRFGHDFSRIPVYSSSPIGGQRGSSAATSAIHATDGNKLSVKRQEGERTLNDGPVTTTQPDVLTTTNPVAESASPTAIFDDNESEFITDAPSASYIVPFDRHPLAAPGERIIFRGVFTDPSPGSYQLEFSTTGGHFSSATGPTTRTIAGLRSGNVDFFVPRPWNGTSTVQVVLRVRKISNNSITQTETWNFGLKSYYPTTMSQQEGTGERNLPAVYHYDIGPARATGTAPFYQHQTILERFGNWILANIRPVDIVPAYRTSHSLNSAPAVSQHFLGNYAGNNGTFTVDSNDRIADQHGGHPNLSNLVSNLATPKDIEVALPQTYEARPGTALGNYTVTRVLKANGVTWKVKKG